MSRLVPLQGDWVEAKDAKSALLQTARRRPKNSALPWHLLPTMSGTHSGRKLRRVPHERISIDQMEWQSTFPHLVQPRLDEDESLPGFLLRCDAVNGWPCGFTFGFTSFGQVPIELSMTALVVPTLVNCQILADALAIDVHDIEATTYVSEITTLFSLGSERPLAAYIGKSQPFRVCPRCLTEDHLVRRSAALEGLSHCIVHHVALYDRCECGRRLVPFPAGAIRKADPTKLLCDPYACGRCGLGWENLPCTRGNKTVLREEQRLAEIYTAILKDPSVDLLDRVFALLEHRQVEKNSWVERGAQVYRDQRQFFPVTWRTTQEGNTVLAMSVARIARYLIKDGFTGHCLALQYFPTCHNRYVTTRMYPQRCTINVPESELDQPCPCGDLTWRKHIVPRS